jgi:4,5-dihydroxyphthalate decarboxylase
VLPHAAGDIMSKLRLTIACWDYDRTRALREGCVSIDGVEPNCLSLPIEETFFRMMRHQEFDVAEMSLSSYIVSLFRENPPLIAIPVFVSRAFRHSGIFIHTGSGIRQPSDLIGKRIGNPEYQLTAIVWIRGILSDEYCVPITSVRYFTGGQEEAGRIEKTGIGLPPEIQIEPIPAGKILSKMLESGEVDALYAPRAPSTLLTNPNHVQRLFPDYPSVERDYYAKTKIFPIMHVIVIRSELYERYPWVAQSLYKAFVAAKRLADEELRESAALKVMLPWVLSHVQETERLMGRDFWPYGLEENAHTLRTFLRYSWEQGLSRRLLEPQELFAPESLESFKI